MPGKLFSFAQQSWFYNACYDGKPPIEYPAKPVKPVSNSIPHSGERRVIILNSDDITARGIKKQDL